MAMYERAFGFKESPFALQPDPEYCLLLPNHERAYHQLDYSMRNCEGFSVLTGEIGCGKTTLLRRLMDQAGDAFTLGFISDTVRLDGEMLERAMLALGIGGVVRNNWTENYRLFTDFVVSEYTAGRQVVLIVDEAQNLSSEALEEVRVLSNINNGKYRLLHIVLAGQPELRQVLSLPRHEQLMQRVSRVFHLLPLTRKETLQYIVHRLKVAGSRKAVFTLEACELIHDISQGVPRLINQLCDTSLVYAYGMKRRLVTRDIVDMVVRDRLTALSSSRSDLPARVRESAIPDGEPVFDQHSDEGKIVIEPALKLPEDQTLVRGMELVGVDTSTARRFGYSNTSDLLGKAWLDLVVPYDRDRVNKIFQYYHNLRESNFEFSATVKGDGALEREARFSFQKQSAPLDQYFRMRTHFYDDHLSIL